MDSPATMTHSNSGIRDILILKSDRLYADALHRAANDVFPRASIQLFTRLDEARTSLNAKAIDLLLTDINTVDGDVLELLAASLDGARRFQHAFVVINRQETWVLMNLRDLSVDGVFDASSEDSARFDLALRAIAMGQTYWSPSVLERLHSRTNLSNPFWLWLTPTEQLVLAVVGDGSDDQAAAQQLDMKPSAVQSVRRSIHRKLGLRHRGDIIRFAAQSGFVNFMPGSILHPGLSILLSLRRSRQRRL